MISPADYFQDSMFKNTTSLLLDDKAIALEPVWPKT